ncbi:MAG: hypothetical protein ACI9O0_000050 [Paracoccaceae bacterium]|jgi:hypothetical protein
MVAPCKTIAMWSGPRNLSTALMYSFAARGDCAIWDEPFYAAYLAATFLDHPMRNEILVSHETNAGKVAKACAEQPQLDQPLFYQKHMTQHMIPQFDRGFMRQCANVFLIRHPALVVASYAKKREEPSFSDIGFVQQAKLFEEVTIWQGQRPVVIDSQDILASPAQSLGRLCAALGIEYSASMLSWPKGGHQDDGIWASHWYGAVHCSTGFDRPSAGVEALVPEYADLVAQALPYYEALAAFKL